MGLRPHHVLELSAVCLATGRSCSGLGGAIPDGGLGGWACWSVMATESTQMYLARCLGDLCMILNIGHDQKDQDDAHHGEHAERSFLSVPGLRLPHQEPFRADGEKGDQPHQQAES